MQFEIRNQFALGLAQLHAFNSTGEFHAELGRGRAQRVAFLVAVLRHYQAFLFEQAQHARGVGDTPAQVGSRLGARFEQTQDLQRRFFFALAQHQLPHNVAARVG